MRKEEKQAINYYFVRVFNQILSWEEQSFRDMGVSEITLRELHVIEAVYSLKESGRNRMSEIAKHLSITPGSLTTAVNCLVRKGYLAREADENDRRVVMIVPTETARKVNELHQQLHSDMIEGALRNVDDKTAKTIIEILKGLEDFFEGKQNLRR